MEQIKKAYLATLPISLGYIFLGLAFAVTMNVAGYSFWLTIGMSIFIYAGAMQFALVAFMTSGMPLWMVAIMSVMINGRLMFYGLPLVQTFKKMGWKYSYMIFSLTDETFSVLMNVKENEKDEEVLFLIALLDHIYWIIGTVIGCVLGNTIPFDLTGIDFSMTALFIVIVLSQFEKRTSIIPFVIGGVVGIVMLFVLGPSYFLLPSLAVTFLLFMMQTFYQKGRDNHV